MGRKPSFEPCFLARQRTAHGCVRCLVSEWAALLAGARRRKDRSLGVGPPSFLETLCGVVGGPADETRAPNKPKLSESSCFPSCCVPWESTQPNKQQKYEHPNRKGKKYRMF
mmetsp:Transcript_7124/g.17189  ORF Transcript_7124/g.17189 Transcript_7124/m.17189 type:complete len:112 (+) Transcript_7124:1168-1503(+)